MVAPKKAKITTLKDLYYRNTPDGTVPPAEWFQRSQSNTKHSTTPNTTTTTNPPYCQPVGSANSLPPPPLQGKPSNIPLFTIAGLPQQDSCAATLQRIYQEFSPIIHHRGYNIQSISEMCCCGDGWTGRGGGGGSSSRNRNSNSNGSGRSRSSTKKPTGRIMHKNVWGYNMTVRGGRGAQPSRIHLRLRQPYDHTQFVSWDFVAGTMAHELAHCVHQNHDAGFYKLMEELLDEHAQYQLYGITTTPTTPPMLMPEQGGYKLGSGRTSTTTTTGNKNNPTSRLLEELCGGHRLGGIKNTTTATHSSQQQHPPHPVPLRERIAIAAETRKRQMIHIKHMIEQQSSREPCVIDLCEEDDDDDDDNNDDDNDDNTKTNDHASRNRGKKKHDNVKKQEPTTRRIGNNNNNDQSIVIIDDDTDNEDADDNTAQKKVPSKSIGKVSKQRWEQGEEGKEERANTIPTNSKNTTLSSTSSVSLSQQHWSRRQQHDEMKDMYDNNSTGIIDLTNTILSASASALASASASASASRANNEENNGDDDDVIVSHVVQASTNNHRRLKRKNDHRQQAPSSSSSSSSLSRSRNSSRSALLHSTGWSCGRCTFQNEDTMVRCSMCNESKDYFDPCKSYNHKSTFR